MQQTAQEAFKKHIEQLRTTKHVPFDGALLAIDTQTGAIKSYVGGYDFASSKFDRVRMAYRQMGSTFKVLIYAAALQAGKKFSDIAIDEPLSLVQPDGSVWSPRNYSRDYKGQMTLAYALSRSNNIVAIKTLLEIGMQSVIDLAIQCHLHDHLQPYPSLALGCIDTTLMSVVGMFNIFANNGYYAQPYSLVWIKDRYGNKIWKKCNEKTEQIFTASISGQVAQVLSLSMKRWRMRNNEPWIDVDAISKTGTTDDSRTCWFVGSTPSITTGVSIACDDNRSMGENIFPIHTAFPIWLAFNRSIPHMRTHFVYDTTLHEVIIDQHTGKQLAHVYEPNAIKILV
jgi:penicillin-binding protein 1A